jgi:predicted nucleic acid-binding protein
MAETPGLSPRDAIHAAVVIEHGLDGIVSADQDLDRIPGLGRYDPIEVAAG